MTVTTELVIARHGEAVCNTLGIVGGDIGCTGLSETGRDQAQRLAARLAAEHATAPFDTLIATPRLRVAETATIVAQALQLPINTTADLRGPDHGAADGRRWYDIKTRMRGAPQAHPDQSYADGADSWNSYLARAHRVLSAILAVHDGHRILIIGHGETSEAAHALLLGLPPNASQRLRFLTDHTAITRWQRHIDRFDHPVWALAAHNDTRHLA